MGTARLRSRIFSVITEVPGQEDLLDEAPEDDTAQST
jgi:hypothetical protein